MINLPAVLLGFPLETLAGLVAFRGLWAIYIHSNVRLPIGPLRWLIGAPELHHWHHARERLGCNHAKSLAAHGHLVPSRQRSASMSRFPAAIWRSSGIRFGDDGRRLGRNNSAECDNCLVTSAANCAGAQAFT